MTLRSNPPFELLTLNFSVFSKVLILFKIIMCDMRHACVKSRLVFSYTVEPPINGHVGDEHFVHCSEVVPSLEVEMYGQYR